MSSLSNAEAPKAFTKPHRRMMHLLSELGLDVQAEVRVGRYRLDAFCEEVWLGFEADGRRAHAFRRESDEKRDRWLFEEAGIPILRLDEQVVRKVCWEETKTLVLEFIEQHTTSLEERKARGRWALT